VSVINVSEAATFLGMGGAPAAELTALQGRLDAAEAEVARKAGPLTPTQTTVRVRGGGSSLALPVARVTSLVSVTPTGGGAALSLTGLSVDPDDSRVTGPGVFTAASYVVVCMAGWSAPLPADLREAVLEQLRYRWEPQRGPTRRGQDKPAPPKPGQLAPRAAELVDAIPGAGFA